MAEAAGEVVMSVARRNSDEHPAQAHHPSEPFRLEQRQQARRHASRRARASSSIPWIPRADRLKADLHRRRYRHAGFRQGQSGGGTGLCRRRRARRRHQGDAAVVRALGLGLDGEHSGLRPAGRSVQGAGAAYLEVRRADTGAGDVRAGRPGAAEAVLRHHRPGAGGSGQHIASSRRAGSAATWTSATWRRARCCTCRSR